MNETNTRLQMIINFIVYWFSGDNLAELMMTITYAAVKPAVAIYVGGTIVKDYLIQYGSKWKHTQSATSFPLLKS